MAGQTELGVSLPQEHTAASPGGADSMQEAQRVSTSPGVEHLHLLAIGHPDGAGLEKS